jgi:hypothetical protein
MTHRLTTEELGSSIMQLVSRACTLGQFAIFLPYRNREQCSAPVGIMEDFQSRARG